MDSLTRFRTAMSHQQPDRVPLDMGGTTLTGMRPDIQKRLAGLLGFPDRPKPEGERIDRRILEWAGSDFLSVGGIVDLPSTLTRKLSETSNIDCWGIKRDLIGGDFQITGSPLQNSTLEDLKSYPWPEPVVNEKLLAQWEAQAKELKKQGRFVVVAEHPVFGILELGCWMCGYDTFMTKLAVEQDFVKLFFEKFLAIQLQVIEQYYSVLGPYIELTTSGDDFGMQTGPLLSSKMFQELIAPYFKARIAATKAKAKCFYWHHSCGSIPGLIDNLIECGVDILNPIQTSAKGMEAQALKDRFGKRLVFWGAVDVQQFLPHAKPQEVKAEVVRLRDILGQDGGYVMAPAHEILDDIPPENLAAWVEAIR